MESIVWVFGEIASPISLLISALGGAVAALFLKAFFKLVGKIWSRCIRLAEYDCSDSPLVRPRIVIGILLHGRGEWVKDPDATNGQAWKHTLKPPPAEEDRDHTIYGPYVNDFVKPGFYRVRFRICGDGFTPKDSTPVLILDLIQRPVFLTDENMILLGQRVVRAKELSHNKYRWFDVYCYVTGGGHFEYRCLVIPESFKPNVHNLRFDTIRVHSYVPIWKVS